MSSNLISLVNIGAFNFRVLIFKMGTINTNFVQPIGLQSPKRDNEDSEYCKFLFLIIIISFAIKCYFYLKGIKTTFIVIKVVYYAFFKEANTQL